MTGDPTSDGIVAAAKALADPIRLAIEKIATGVGALYEPTSIRRKALAEVDAEFIKAIGKEDVAALSQAAENRTVYRRIRQEMNLRLIADRTWKNFEDTTVPPDASPPPDEWVDEFTDQCKDASTDELRELWARLYVAETKMSGTVPRRVLRIVRDLDASLAKSFSRLLGCCIEAEDGRLNVLAFPDWLSGVNLSFRDLRELEDVGLVTIPAFNSQITSGHYCFSQGRILRLTTEKPLAATVIALTSAGLAVSTVAERVTDEKYVENLCAMIRRQGARAEYPLFRSATSN
jgi:hypothetical protein